jgi:hypothetical protein
MKSHKIVSLLVLILIASGLTLLACENVTASAKPLQQPLVLTVQLMDNASVICSEGIEPGKTTHAEVIGKLGKPMTTSINAVGGEVLEFPSIVEFIPTTIDFNKDLVYLVTKINEDDSKSIKWLKSNLGEPEKMTYSFFGQGTMTYLYPQKGFTAIVDEDSDQLLWLQCFLPMSLKDYLAGWGSRLPLEDPYIR